jgi:hypothetical protein
MIDYTIQCVTSKPRQWVKVMSVVSHIFFKMRLIKLSWAVADLCMSLQSRYPR